MIEIPITRTVEPAGLLHEIFEGTRAEGFADSSRLVIAHNPENRSRAEFEAILAAHDPTTALMPPSFEEQLDALLEGGTALEAMRARRLRWQAMAGGAP